MRLVKIHIGTILLTDFHNISQITVFTLHTIYTLDNHHDLPPRPPRPRLAHNNCLPQYLLQMLRIIMTEAADGRPARPRTVDNARVVEFITHNQIPPLHECGDGGGIGVEAHVDHHAGFFPNEIGHQLLHLVVQFRRPGLHPTTGHTYRQTVHALQHAISTSCFPIIGKSEVVVTPEVEAVPGNSISTDDTIKLSLLVHLRLFTTDILQLTQNLHSLIPIITYPLQHMNLRPRTGCHWTIKTILDTMIQPPRIKILKTLEKRCITRYIIGDVIRILPNVGEVSSPVEDLGAKFTDMSYEDEYGVAEVGRPCGEECNGWFAVVFE
mmetsp:Transcript_5035/g.7413  ORF Transcript_5035/g.7413 Transcript_5035/m.7413 type:complete len:324 (-) Transcript_5035:1035-2006(-)